MAVGEVTPPSTIKAPSLVHMHNMLQSDITLSKTHYLLLLPPTPPLQVTDHCHLLSIQTNMPNPNPNPNPSKPVLM